jgi:hypothetical protein
VKKNGFVFSPVDHGHYNRLAILDKGHMRDQAGVEKHVDRLPVIAGFFVKLANLVLLCYWI